MNLFVPWVVFGLYGVVTYDSEGNPVCKTNLSSCVVYILNVIEFCSSVTLYISWVMVFII